MKAWTRMPAARGRGGAMKRWMRGLAALAAMAAVYVQTGTALTLSGVGTSLSGSSAYLSGLAQLPAVWPETHYGIQRPWYYWSETIYVACGEDGLYVSPNGGWSFQKMPIVVNGADINAAVFDVAFDTDSAGSVVAMYAGTDKGLYVNRGFGFSRIPLVSPWGTDEMWVYPVSTGLPGVVSAGGFISRDGGRTFKRLQMNSYAYAGNNMTNCYGSIFSQGMSNLEVSHDNGTTWLYESPPWSSYPPWACTAVSTDSKGRAWLNYFSGVAVYDPQSRTFSARPWAGGKRETYGIFVTEFSGEPAHVYAATDDGLYISRDGGFSATRSVLGGYAAARTVYVSTPLYGAVYAAFTDQVAFGTTSSVLAWSFDGGNTFSRITNGLPAGPLDIKAIKGVPQREL